MKYIKGYTIKPKKVVDGKVIFTDGTTEFPPSQKACEDYGYKYNSITKACERPFSTKVNLISKISGLYNKVLGKNNSLGSGVENSIVAGAFNKLKGSNKNVFINGNKNTVEAGVFNSSIVSGDNNLMKSYINNSTIISGTGAISIRDNETVVGGFYTDGLLRNSVAQPFTSQTSNFNMQLSLNNSTSLSKLKTANGSDFVSVHTNSFVSVTADCMITGDTLAKFSSGTLFGKVSVGSNGIPALQSQSYTHRSNSSSNPFGFAQFYLNQSNDGLTISVQGISNEIVVCAASVKIVEIIHDPSIII